MQTETKFLAYWRELNAALAMYRKPPVDAVTASLCWFKLSPTDAAKVLP